LIIGWLNGYSNRVKRATKGLKGYRGKINQGGFIFHQGFLSGEFGRPELNGGILERKLGLKEELARKGPNMEGR